MEQEELSVDPKFLKAFNNGYLLAKHEPELAAKLTAHNNEQNEYFKALVYGAQEYEKETREWAKSFSNGIAAKDDRSLDKER